MLSLHCALVRTLQKCCFAKLLDYPWCADPTREGYRCNLGQNQVPKSAVRYRYHCTSCADRMTSVRGTKLSYCAINCLYHLRKIEGSRKLIFVLFMESNNYIDCEFRSRAQSVKILTVNPTITWYDCRHFGVFANFTYRAVLARTSLQIIK